VKNLSTQMLPPAGVTNVAKSVVDCHLRATRSSCISVGPRSSAGRCRPPFSARAGRIGCFRISWRLGG